MELDDEPDVSVVRSVAWESKATKRPSPEIQGLWLSPFASVLGDPPVVPVTVAEGAVTSFACPLARSQTNTFVRPDADAVVPEPGVTRFDAADSNATNRPSELIVG